MTSPIHIATNVRNRNCDVKQQTLDAILSLYPPPSIFGFDGIRLKGLRKNSYWEINERKDFSVPFFLEEERKELNGFCAVYRKNGVAKTLIRGEFEINSKTAAIESHRQLNRMDVSRTIDVLTNKVLEQGRFSWPPRGLNAENGSLYGFERAGLGLCGLFSLASVDIGVSLFSDYDSLLLKTGQYAVLFVLAAIASVPLSIIGGSYIGNTLGKRADLKRVRNLPKAAFSFTYGREAEAEIHNEYVLVQNELRKTRFHELIHDMGFPVSKKYSLGMYNFLMEADLREKSAKEYLETKVYLEKYAKDEVMVPFPVVADAFMQVKN